MYNQHHQAILLFANKFTSSETMFSLFVLSSPVPSNFYPSYRISKYRENNHSWCVLPHITTISSYRCELSLPGCEDGQTHFLLIPRASSRLWPIYCSRLHNAITSFFYCLWNHFRLSVECLACGCALLLLIYKSVHSVLNLHHSPFLFV